ncbi:MAG: TonB-dependent receptor plug domain-containing protein, partial [Nitrospirales bacterium]
DGRLEFNFRWLNGDINFDNGSVSGPFDVFKAKNTSNQFVFSGSYDQPITQWWSQKLTLARAEERLISQSGTFQRNVTTGVVSPVFPFPGDIQTLTNRLEWQHNFQLGKPLLLTAGYQFREGQGKNVTTTPQLDNLISSHAGFAQAQVNLWDRLFFTAGLRQDSFNVFGDATTYRVTAGYLQKEIGTKVRGGYATGFRAPTINELFFPNFGNPNLQPEKSQSFDVGVDQFLLEERLKVSAGYFWNRFRNLLVTTFDPVSCAPFSTFGFCPLNVGSAKTQGWEAGFTYAIAKDLPWIKSLDLQGNYTYTLTRDLDTGARLPRWPVHQWTGILSYQPVDPFRINLAYRYLGSRFSTTGNQQPLGAFNVVTLSATYDVTKRVQAYTRIENLFNEEYEEILNFGTPVRSIYGGVSIKY